MNLSGEAGADVAQISLLCRRFQPARLENFDALRMFRAQIWKSRRSRFGNLRYKVPLVNGWPKRFSVGQIPTKKAVFTR
jgi:hypothetical protein